MNKPIRFHVSTSALVLTATVLLQACAPMVVGGFVGGTMVVTDRRTSGAQLEDEGIEIKGSSRIKEALNGKAHVNLASFNRQVLITGEATNERDVKYIAEIVSQVDNVRSVLNEVQVANFSTFSERSQDVLIQSKVKASLIDSKDIFASAFKVHAERGVIYLMGRVTQREADRAVDIARNVSGVQKVVKVFEIITENELKALLPAPGKTPAPNAK
jgi:osmotically-inducible protein OsmY